MAMTIREILQIATEGDGGYPEPTGTKTITENGTGIDVKDFALADVNVPNPSTGSLSITKNGTYDVTEKASADVNVPNPSTGSITFTKNGSYNVKSKATAVVAVPEPTGTKTITENGTGINVKDFAYADVNVPNPSKGSITITENGTYDVTDLASAEVDVESAGKAIEPQTLNFWDYDGTIVASYDWGQIEDLTELPPNPAHPGSYGQGGLVAQGWNWTLSEIKAYFAAYPDAIIDVGQMYTTDDGATRIYVHLEEARKSPAIKVILSGELTVDWGDGNTETLTGYGGQMVSTAPHKYDYAGDYVISLKVSTGGQVKITSANGSADRLLSGTDYYSTAFYMARITVIEIGEGVAEIDGSAFCNCRALRTVTIPSTLTTIGDDTFSCCRSLINLVLPPSLQSITYQMFNSCYSLKRICIGPNITSIDESAFGYCNSLENITIPQRVVDIGAGAFQNCAIDRLVIPTGLAFLRGTVAESCHLLSFVVLPSSLTKIGASFGNCASLTSIKIPASVQNMAAYGVFEQSGLMEIHLECTQPPQIASNTFANLPDDFVIYIPAGTLQSYQNAENWGAYVNRLVEE